MFGDHLKELQLKLGLKDDEMAERLDMSKTTYWRLKHSAKPHLERVDHVCKTFQVNAYEWLQEDAPGSSPGQPSPVQNAKPRVIHIAERQVADESDANWRSRAIDLLARMADMLETLIRSSRGGGGVSKPISGQADPVEPICAGSYQLAAA